MTQVAKEGPTATAPPQSRNHILAVLPPAEFLQLRPHLSPVELTAKQRLSESHQPIPAVYFPLDAVISVTALGASSGGVEVGSVGCEGMVGVPLLFGSDRSPTRSMVQIAGAAERMEAATLQREADRHPEFQRLLRLYTLGFLAQISQSTACNRLHPAERRLARWLLICRDRVGRDDVPITHEAMAHMLGVRRATVTEAAGSLQREGLIRYRRGVVTLVDRPRLEAAACECYRIVREEFDRLLGVRVG